MEYCSNCGKSIENGWNRCPYCGSQVFVTDTREGDTSREKESYGNHMVNGFPMKWYKFVIYVQLFLAMISLTVAGLGMVTGLQYGGAYREVYGVFGFGVRVADIVFGFLHLALVPVAFVVRQRLVNFKAGAPRLLLIFYILEFGVGLVYSFVMTIMNGIIAFDSSTLVMLFGVVVMVYFSGIYFEKRKKLFCR